MTRQYRKRNRVTVKEQRVGLYVMPQTRGMLNLVKAQINNETGQTLNQDEIIQHLIQTFEHARRTGLLSELTHA